MPSQLPNDCLNYIRILWRDVWKFSDYDKPHTIINTLIAFLPKESKELLHKNCITIPIQKPPLFNYPSFCKIISIDNIKVITRRTLKKQQSITSKSLVNAGYLSQEILKMFMNQISSLKVLEVNSCYTEDFKFIYYLEQKSV
ncbi:unnamed protein product [Rhizophagus irregularis]|nr:unnamed protein product [Rhizophagus irregularis]